MNSIYAIFYFGRFEGYIWSDSEESAITDWLEYIGYDVDSVGYTAKAPR